MGAVHKTRPPGRSRLGVHSIGKGPFVFRVPMGRVPVKLPVQLWVWGRDEGHKQRKEGREAISCRLTVLWPFTTMKPCLIWLTRTGQVLWLERSMSRSHTSAWRVQGECSAPAHTMAALTPSLLPCLVPSPGPHATEPPWGCPPHSSPHSPPG